MTKLIPKYQKPSSPLRRVSDTDEVQETKTLTPPKLQLTDWSNPSNYEGINWHNVNLIREIQLKQTNEFKEQADAALDYVLDYYQSDGYKRRAEAEDYKGVPAPDSLKVNTNPNMPIYKSNSFGVGLASPYLTNAMYEGRGRNARINTDAIPNYALDPFYLGAHENTHRNAPYWKKWLTNIYGKPYATDALEEEEITYPMPQSWLNILNKGEVIKGQSADHDSRTNEKYSDLMGTRANLWKFGIFDSRDPNATFTPKMYDEYKAKVGKMGDRFLEMFKKKDFIDAVNNIAHNPQSSNDTFLKSFV